MNNEINLWMDTCRVILHDSLDDSDRAEAANNLYNALNTLEGEVLCGIFTEEEAKKIIYTIKVRILQLINHHEK